MDIRVIICGKEDEEMVFKILILSVISETPHTIAASLETHFEVVEVLSCLVYNVSRRTRMEVTETIMIQGEMTSAAVIEIVEDHLEIGIEIARGPEIEMKEEGQESETGKGIEMDGGDQEEENGVIAAEGEIQAIETTTLETTETFEIVSIEGVGEETGQCLHLLHRETVREEEVEIIIMTVLEWSLM